MNEIRFAARKTQRDFHWAWYLFPFGTVAVCLLTATLVMMQGEGPAPTLAVNAMPMAAETTVAGPALAAEPVGGWPAPAPADGTEVAEQPPTF